ncbi:MAG: hypothetical protein ACK526_02100 [Planctomyces sp.]
MWINRGHHERRDRNVSPIGQNLFGLRPTGCTATGATLLSSFNVGDEATDAIRAFFFSGALIAGLFGLTLSKMTIVQAAVGLAGLWAVLG